METLETLTKIDQILKATERFKSRAAVVYWALKSMKENPEQSIISALEDGINEWLK